MQGEYGLSDLCISVPAIVGDDGVRQVLEIPLNEKEIRNSVIRQMD